MRVLFLVHGFPPDAIGGTEIYVHDLAHALTDRFSDEVRVLTRVADPSRPEFSTRREERDGLDVTTINNTFRSADRFKKTYLCAEARESVGIALDEFKPDAVHVHHLTGLSLDVWEEVLQRNVRLVATLNDYWLICQRGQLLDRSYERCNGPQPTACSHCWSVREEDLSERMRLVKRFFDSETIFLAPSLTLRERFLEAGLEESRILLQRQGIRIRSRRAERRQPGLPLRIGFVGSLIRSKAPHVLLDAVRDLPQGSARLVLAGAYADYHGETGYRGVLADGLMQPSVTWRGPVSHEDAWGLMGECDVLVVPSIWIENAPFTIKEAFAAGVPVIASDLGGMAELVQDEINGLLFSPGDASSLRRALRRLIDEPDLLPRLRAGIPAIKSIEEDAAWTREVYTC